MDNEYFCKNCMLVHFVSQNPGIEDDFIQNGPQACDARCGFTVVPGELIEVKGGPWQAYLDSHHTYTDA